MIGRARSRFLPLMLLASTVVCGCAIDPAIPPQMMREIEKTMPVCSSEKECMEKMRAAKRWVLQRAGPWDLTEQVKDQHVLPKAKTILMLDEQHIVLLYWHRMPGAYFSYWIVDATIFGAELRPGQNDKRLHLRYTSRFQGRSYQRTSTDYDARTSWGETVLAFNRYVNGTVRVGTPGSSRRTEALTRTRRLERSPLGRQAEDDRRWLMSWLIDDPVLGQVRYCIDALGPSWELKYRYAREIETQLLFSAVAAALSAGERTSRDKMFVAGVQGVLDAYQAILKKEPTAKQSSLDLLLEKDRRGELKDYLSSLQFFSDTDGCVPSH